MESSNPKLYHNKNAFEDLAIDTEIFTAINRTTTRYGAIKLRNRLRYCSSDIGYLNEMTKKNYMINIDSEFRTRCMKALADVKAIEDSIDMWMVEECAKDLIFNTNIFNNRIFLTTTNKLKFSSMLIVICIYVLIYLYLYYHELVGSPISYTKGIITGYYEFVKLMMYLIMSNIEWIERTALVVTSIYVGYLLYNTYQSVNTCYEHYGVCGSFYREYENVVKFVDVAEKLCKIDIYHDTSHVKRSIEFLRYYFTDEVSLGFSLVTKLSTDDYVKHIDTLSNYVGKIDYLMSVSTLIDEGYTVPNVVKSNFPILHVSGVWNPLIKPDLRVKNSIELNLTKPNIVIVTGPNKAGKSTFMRSIITTIYMAQSLGICCADRLSLTPFRDIFTYLNVPDCVGRESLFEAEINRCYTYIDKIESFRGFSIGIVDELFTGTNPTEGEAASYAILNRISDNPINITILSTHFHDIIEKLDKNKFTFKKFTAKKIKGSEKMYKFNYLMEDGVSDQHIALELLKEKGFDKEIVDDALNYVKMKKSKTLVKNK